MSDSEVGVSMGHEQRDLFDKQPPPWELDDQREMCVAVVAFPEVPFGPYDYEVPAALRAEVQPGVRVQVPLGRGNRKRLGYCIAVENRSGRRTALKPIDSVADGQSLLSPAMLRLTQWMARYYVCPLGQVLDAVIPAGVRGQAGTREQVYLNVPTATAARLTQLRLSAKQADALRILAGSSRAMTPQELAAAAGCTSGPIQELRRKKLVSVEVRRVHPAFPMHSP